MPVRTHRRRQHPRITQEDAMNATTRLRAGQGGGLDPDGLP